MRTFLHKAIEVIEVIAFWLGFFLCFVGAGMGDANIPWSETKWLFIAGIGMMIVTVILGNLDKE